ncbi:MAG: nuclear transport factor 2 family protein [Fimbriimonadales bacterium]
MNSDWGPTTDTNELAIRNLLARIAHMADQGHLDEYVELFTVDASWELPDSSRRGRAEIRAGAEERRGSGLSGPGSFSRHVITTVAVQLIDNEKAVADSYFLFYRNTATSPTIFNMGHYHDDLRFDEGAWRIARRQITFG